MVCAQVLSNMIEVTKIWANSALTYGEVNTYKSQAINMPVVSVLTETGDCLKTMKTKDIVE